jgi:hypothetical protein
MRPDQFVGVQLVGGKHTDAWQSSNVFAQFLVGLATGFPSPENIEAVQVIAQSWINDWYEGTNTGIDGERGSTITIPTETGAAEAYVLPAPPYQFTIIDLILNAFIQAGAYLTVFQSCAAPIGGIQGDMGVQTAVSMQMSTPNTPLTLDGRAQTVQSVGQHVCTG